MQSYDFLPYLTPKLALRKLCTRTPFLFSFIILRTELDQINIVTTSPIQYTQWLNCFTISKYSKLYLRISLQAYLQGLPFKAPVKVQLKEEKTQSYGILLKSFGLNDLKSFHPQ